MNQFCEDLIKIVSAGVWLAVFPLAVSRMIEEFCGMKKSELRKSARVIAAIVIICMVILVAGYTIVALFVIK